MDTQTETPKLSLIAKIAAACDAVGGIEKKGRNVKQGYDYLKAADVAKAIRHEFFSRGVILTFDEKEFTQIRTVRTNSGGEMGEFLIKGEFTFHDADSGEKLGPLGAFGVAMDTSDKAIWKAKTGALKYVLRGVGLIPDEKDDPEHDEKVDKAIDGTTYAEEFDQRTEGQRHIAPFQVAAFTSSCKATGKTPDIIAAYLKTIKAGSVEEILRSQFNEAIKWANSQQSYEDLTAKLSESIEAAKAKKAAKANGGVQSKCYTHGVYQGEGNCPKCAAQ